MSNDDSPGTFEVEVATTEEFLCILSEREAESGEPGRGKGIRRDVFVARLTEERGSRFGFPLVRRCVVASFIYGRDVVSYRRTTSSVVELPEILEAMEERQRAVYEEIRVEIERGLEEQHLDVLLREGFLHHPSRAGKDS